MSAISSPKTVRLVSVLGWGVLAFLFLLVALERRACAHDLKIDRVELRPWAQPGELRGELLLDPELTRETGRQLSRQEASARLVQFLEEQLSVVVDGRRVSCKFSVRELWRKGGAVAGDLIAVHAALGSTVESVSVSAGKRLNPLAVTIDAAGPGQGARLSSFLLEGGDSTPGYSRGGGQGWEEGGGERFEELMALRPPGPFESPGVWHARTETQLWRFFVLGIKHIVPLGWDHLAFVSALVFGGFLSGKGARWRWLLLQISFFTLAHSCTLALGVLRWFTLPSEWVEPLIALSILIVGLENLLWNKSKPAHLVVVFGFGLLHGLGFASALTEIGLPSSQLGQALLSFNLGVELGQLAVVAFWLGALRLLRRKGSQTRVALWGSVAVVVLGAYWSVSRLL